MQLHRLEIHNFKCIEYLDIDWQDLVVLIGENNSGKSSVLLALSYFLSGGSIKDPLLFRGHETGEANAIELIGHFDQLTEIDLAQQAVRGRTENGEWILKKKYWCQPAETEEEASEWQERLYSFSPSESFAQWPEREGTWAAFPADYQPLIQQLPDNPRSSVASREALRQIVRAQRPDLVVMSPASWVPNPGGGGNWKSNANSILPRAIFVKAVHEASDETNAKDASTYGKLINLIIERQLAQRPEMGALRQALDNVMALFRPDEADATHQAPEIRELEARINASLADVVSGQAFIRTTPLELRTLVMPSTSLLIRDPIAGIETQIGHQGHGLQRTLVITMLQLLVETQERMAAAEAGVEFLRPAILLIEEPELYMHPQMERRMRDVLYRLAQQPGLQVMCCTHSPVFLDIADRYKSIVRLTKSGQGAVTGKQFTGQLFEGPAADSDRQRLHAIARFNPAVNELFFTNQVVLLEEFSAIVAFERAAELVGLFERHPRLRREVCLVDCAGKGSMPGFQKVLNKFEICYRAIYDADAGNQVAIDISTRIVNAALANPNALTFEVQPNDLESLLGYTAPSKHKPLRAYERVSELHAAGPLPPDFLTALHMVYFGTPQEPAATV